MGGAGKQNKDDTDVLFTSKMELRAGTKLEALDYTGNWFPAKILKVKVSEKEVLVHFDKWSSRFDVWLPHNSPKIRPLKGVKKKEKEWRLGDRIIAKWGPAGKTYPATISKIVSESSVEVIFYDGFKKVVSKSSLKLDTEKLYRQYDSWEPRRQIMTSPATASTTTLTGRSKRRLIEPVSMADYVTDSPATKRVKPNPAPASDNESSVVEEKSLLQESAAAPLSVPSSKETNNEIAEAHRSTRGGINDTPQTKQEPSKTSNILNVEKTKNNLNPDVRKSSRISLTQDDVKTKTPNSKEPGKKSTRSSLRHDDDENTISNKDLIQTKQETTRKSTRSALSEDQTKIRQSAEANRKYSRIGLKQNEVETKELGLKQPGKNSATGEERMDTKQFESKQPGKKSTRSTSHYEERTKIEHHENESVRKSNRISVNQDEEKTESDLIRKSSRKHSKEEKLTLEDKKQQTDSNKSARLSKDSKNKPGSERENLIQEIKKVSRNSKKLVSTKTDVKSSISHQDSASDVKDVRRKSTRSSSLNEDQHENTSARKSSRLNLQHENEEVVKDRATTRLRSNSKSEDTQKILKSSYKILKTPKDGGQKSTRSSRKSSFSEDDLVSLASIKQEFQGVKMNENKQGDGEWSTRSSRRSSINEDDVSLAELQHASNVKSQESAQGKRSTRSSRRNSEDDHSLAAMKREDSRTNKDDSSQVKNNGELSRKEDIKLIEIREDIQSTGESLLERKDEMNTINLVVMETQKNGEIESDEVKGSVPEKTIDDETLTENITKNIYSEYYEESSKVVQKEEQPGIKNEIDSDQESGVLDKKFTIDEEEDKVEAADAKSVEITTEINNTSSIAEHAEQAKELRKSSGGVAIVKKNDSSYIMFPVMSDEEETHVSEPEDQPSGIHNLIDEALLESFDAEDCRSEEDEDREEEEDTGPEEPPTLLVAMQPNNRQVPITLESIISNQDLTNSTLESMASNQSLLVEGNSEDVLESTTAGQNMDDAIEDPVPQEVSDTMALVKEIEETSINQEIIPSSEAPIRPKSEITLDSMISHMSKPVSDTEIVSESETVSLTSTPLATTKVTKKAKSEITLESMTSNLTTKPKVEVVAMRRSNRERKEKKFMDDSPEPEKPKTLTPVQKSTPDIPKTVTVVKSSEVVENRRRSGRERKEKKFMDESPVKKNTEAKTEATNKQAESKKADSRRTSREQRRSSESVDAKSRTENVLQPETKIKTPTTQTKKEISAQKPKKNEIASQQFKTETAESAQPTKIRFNFTPKSKRTETKSNDQTNPMETVSKAIEIPTVTTETAARRRSSRERKEKKFLDEEETASTESKSTEKPPEVEISPPKKKDMPVWDDLPKRQTKPLEVKNKRAENKEAPTDKPAKKAKRFEDKYELFKKKWKEEKQRRRSRACTLETVDTTPTVVEKSVVVSSKTEKPPNLEMDKQPSAKRDSRPEKPKADFSLKDISTTKQIQPVAPKEATPVIPKEATPVIKEDITESTKKDTKPTQPKVITIDEEPTEETDVTKIKAPEKNTAEIQSSMLEKPDATIDLTTKPAAIDLTSKLATTDPKPVIKRRRRRKTEKDSEFVPEGFMPDTSRTPNSADTLSMASMVTEERPSQRKRAFVVKPAQRKPVSTQIATSRQVYPSSTQLVAARIQKRVHQQKVIALQAANQSATDEEKEPEEIIIIEPSLDSQLTPATSLPLQTSVSPLQKVPEPEKIKQVTKTEFTKKKINEIDLTGIKLGPKPNSQVNRRKRCNVDFIAGRLKYKQKMQQIKNKDSPKKDSPGTPLFLPQRTLDNAYTNNNVVHTPSYDENTVIVTPYMPPTQPPTSQSPIIPASQLIVPPMMSQRMMHPVITQLSPHAIPLVPGQQPQQTFLQQTSFSPPMYISSPPYSQPIIRPPINPYAYYRPIPPDFQLSRPLDNSAGAHPKKIFPKGMPTTVPMQLAHPIDCMCHVCQYNRSIASSQVAASPNAVLNKSAEAKTAVEKINKTGLTISSDKVKFSEMKLLQEKRNERRRLRREEQKNLRRSKKTDTSTEAIANKKPLPPKREFKCKAEGCEQVFAKRSLLAVHNKACHKVTKPPAGVVTSPIVAPVSFDARDVVPVPSVESPKTLVKSVRMEISQVDDSHEEVDSSETESECEEELPTVDDCVKCKCQDECELGFMIQCEQCLTWQHGECVGFAQPKAVPLFYLCHICSKPKGLRTASFYDNDLTWHRHGQLPPVSPKKPDIFEQEQPDTSVKLVDEENTEVLNSIMLVSHSMVTELYAMKDALQKVRNKFLILQKEKDPRLLEWSNGKALEEIKNTISNEKPPKIESESEANAVKSSDENKEKSVRIETKKANENESLDEGQVSSISEKPVISSSCNNLVSSIDAEENKDNLEIQHQSINEKENMVSDSNGLDCKIEQVFPKSEEINNKILKTRKESGFTEFFGCRSLDNVNTDICLDNVSDKYLLARYNLLQEIEKSEDAIEHRLKLMNTRLDELEREYENMDRCKSILEDLKKDSRMNDFHPFLDYLQSMKWKGIVEELNQNKTIIDILL